MKLPKMWLYNLQDERRFEERLKDYFVHRIRTGQATVDEADTRIRALRQQLTSEAYQKHISKELKNMLLELDQHISTLYRVAGSAVRLAAEAHTLDVKVSLMADLLCEEDVTVEEVKQILRFFGIRKNHPSVRLSHDLRWWIRPALELAQRGGKIRMKLLTKLRRYDDCD